MVFMLILGAALAAGHHIFYQSLDRKPPPNSVYSIRGISAGLTGQQINLAWGRTFYLCRAGHVEGDQNKDLEASGDRQAIDHHNQYLEYG